MKKFKKTIILLITVFFIVIYFVYDYLNNDIAEIVEEDIFVKEEVSKETKTIILHITGEVNKPRSC